MYQYCLVLPWYCMVYFNLPKMSTPFMIRYAEEMKMVGRIESIRGKPSRRASLFSQSKAVAQDSSIVTFALDSDISSSLGILSTKIVLPSCNSFAEFISACLLNTLNRMHALHYGQHTKQRCEGFHLPKTYSGVCCIKSSVSKRTKEQSVSRELYVSCNTIC